MKGYIIYIALLAFAAIVGIFFMCLGADDEIEKFYGEKKFRDKTYIKTHYKLKKYEEL